MIFKRFYDDNLAQASYMIACEKTREAIVVDPTLDTGQYVRAAGGDRLRITHVAETHIHADFVSGSRALADTTGAQLHLSGLGGRAFGYSDGALANANTRPSACRGPTICSPTGSPFTSPHGTLAAGCCVMLKG